MNENVVLSVRPGLAVRPLTPQIWHMITEIAPVLYKSRLFGVTSVEGAMGIALKGYELGMGITASFEFIQVVQGKPTLSPRGALALILQCGELAGMKVTEALDACTVWMKRTNGLEYQLTFTMEDARKTGQVKPGSAWESYQANMLRWRCVGFVADVVFPDIIGGMKRADEFGAAIDENGDVIEGQWTVSTSATQPAQAPAGQAGTPAPEAPAVSLSDLVARYGANVVIAANDGKIPGTDDEVRAVIARLEAA